MITIAIIISSSSSLIYDALNLLTKKKRLIFDIKSSFCFMVSTFVLACDRQEIIKVIMVITIIMVITVIMVIMVIILLHDLDLLIGL